MPSAEPSMRGVVPPAAKTDDRSRLLIDEQPRRLLRHAVEGVPRIVVDADVSDLQPHLRPEPAAPEVPLDGGETARARLTKFVVVGPKATPTSGPKPVTGNR